MIIINQKSVVRDAIELSYWVAVCYSQTSDSVLEELAEKVVQRAELLELAENSTEFNIFDTLTMEFYASYLELYYYVKRENLG